MATAIDSTLYKLNWSEKKFDTEVVVDNNKMTSPTHKVDCYKNHIALEVEWNNKDPFFDRDLNNFRLLFDLRTVSVGVIITRSDEFQGLKKAFSANTTHWGQLVPRIEGGGGGGCPILAFGIRLNLLTNDTTGEPKSLVSADVLEDVAQENE